MNKINKRNQLFFVFVSNSINNSLYFVLDKQIKQKNKAIIRN